jgi:hypothetical protein
MNFQHPKLRTLASGILAAAFFLTYTASGQGFYDTAPRFGQNSIFGSAKSMGMGGVQMGVGADGSALATNPAAPGMFRKSDIQFSLNPFLTSTSNTFRGGEVNADRSGMPLSSFSISLTSLKNETEPGDFRAGVFTISYNTLGTFNRRSNWEGNNSQPPSGSFTDNSIIDVYLKNSNLPGFYPSNLIGTGANGDQLIFNDNFKNDLVMAYDAYILDSSQNNFVSAFPRSDLRKSGYYDQALYQRNWNFGYSVNFKERLFFGFSIGHFRSNYSSEVQYGEEIQNVYVDPANPNYNYLQQFKGVNFQIYKNLSQKNRGINGNLGLIYKVSDAFRVSGAIQLPTLTWISEKYSPRITANYNGLPYWGGGTTLGQYDVTWFENDYSYKLRLPAKYRLGLNWIAGKTGMLGADLEYTDFSGARLTEGDGGYNFINENKVIKDSYVPTLNLKLGGEIRYQDLRFRLGFAYMPSPLKSGVYYKNNIPGDAMYYTGGIGGRNETWFWDIALVVGKWDTKYNFVPGLDEDVRSKVTNSQLRLGLGFIL